MRCKVICEWIYIKGNNNGTATSNCNRSAPALSAHNGRRAAAQHYRQWRARLRHLSTRQVQHIGIRHTRALSRGDTRDDRQYYQHRTPATHRRAGRVRPGHNRGLDFYIIRYFTTGNNPQQEAAFNAAWQLAPFRAYIRNMTILWGVVYVAEFFLRLVMVYTIPISQFLIISPIIFYGITILVIWITIRSGANLRRRGEEQRHQEALQAASSHDSQQ
jgi:hypothetical protein